HVWGGLVRTRRLPSVRAAWKLPPEENGGLVAASPSELLAQVELALEDPECCRARSRAFIERYMTAADGRNCERIFEALRSLTRRA
ncbi:MAG TPA: hypothetical protein PLN93_09335, partial [Vicinamibacterales bacterium]|nr:hypothetical protein [Vicinamibacterales bacterium]